MPRYAQVTDGEWVQPVRRGYKMICCDCGLVHTLNFRITRGRVQLQAFRNERSTALVRRYKRVKVTKG
jgi:hypothetical protein